MPTTPRLHVKKRDYYEILGIPRGASADEVKSAYRKLAREHHPDQNADPASVETFKAVAEAYRVLSDSQARFAYDRFGMVPAGSAYGLARAESPEQAVVETIKGFARAAQRRFKATRGKDIELELRLSFEESARGTRRVLELPRVAESDTDGLKTVPRRLEFRIPAGVSDGQVLRWRGEGEPGRFGGRDGDLILKAIVEYHPVYQRDDLDVVVDLPLRPSVLVTGGVVRVPTVDGVQELTITSDMKVGDRIRLSGMGIDDRGRRRGDAVFLLSLARPGTESGLAVASYAEAEEALGPWEGDDLLKRAGLKDLES